MPDKFDETMQFKMEMPKEDKLKSILQNVYSSLEEKGYNPSNQIIGYIISGDPTYITSYNNARKNIKQIDRNDLIESLLEFYFEKNNIK